jgi:hypothetical protein
MAQKLPVSPVVFRPPESFTDSEGNHVHPPLQESNHETLYTDCRSRGFGRFPDIVGQCGGQLLRVTDTAATL